MRILVTNDDGIGAAGIRLLEQIARTFSDDVWVVAPMEEQSGKGRSLTLTQPLRMRSYDERHFAVSGTPTDAVIMALAEIMPDRRPDLILSGINRGANLGEDCLYSGTVAAAMEGALAGIRSIALSQRYAHEGMGFDVAFDAAEHWAHKVLAPLLETPLAPRTLVNINFPPIAADAVKGVKVVAQGLRDYGRPQLEKSKDPRGFDYWWLNLGRVVCTPEADTDLEAIEQGYVTVTPLHLDLTHQASRAALEQIYL
ncbi:5'/3'-nucleotidase SurE [Sphingomonas nostoxanthinifaciens]|uniref:5'/3'-nucleotidase SurE n=1 Tax=Sphingomonas nostoxanthinifaciens TaxID=2872652 RepID=UPI001CC1D9B6|nr:5'/3'-nucleotidase SurE [Sphingomonas nostoxanthinifaciens]UAK22939.1 5'/3'-nucleotidase SurE [Sphingomonas nostoxanthinifaciens]